NRLTAASGTDREAVDGFSAYRVFHPDAVKPGVRRVKKRGARFEDLRARHLSGDEIRGFQMLLERKGLLFVEIDGRQFLGRRGRGCWCRWRRTAGGGDRNRKAAWSEHRKLQANDTHQILPQRTMSHVP